MANQLPTPPGMTPLALEDYHDSRGPAVNIIAWVSTGIGIATVALKLFTRAQITKRTGWDDVLIFVSLAFSIIAAAFVSYSVTLGFGRHTIAVMVEHGQDRLVKTAYWQIMGYPFNIGAFSFPNISIAILIVNLLDPNPKRAYALYTMVWLQVIIALISVVLIFVQCTPTRQLWDPSAGGTCWSPNIFNSYNYFVSAYTTLTDIILAIVPVSVLWKLQMPMKTKVGVCIMMSLTLLSAVVTLVKAVYLHLFTDRRDPLWNVVPLVQWGLIEQNVVLIAACIPTLRPFFHKSSFLTRPSADESDHTRSGSSWKFSANRRKAPSPASWELALREEESKEGSSQRAVDVESNDSQAGIWRKLDVHVSSRHDLRSGEDGPPGRKYKEIVPSNLREQS